MDYSKFFSSDVPSFLRSPVREIFRKVDLSAICSFAGGYPAACTFPLADIPGLTERVLAKYGTKALQYGATQGVPELRELIAARYGVPVSQVQITTSSQQGIDVCARVFLDPGDVVLASNPVYLGALQSFRAYRAEVVELCHFDRPEGVEKSPAIKFIYVIPDFNNPTGKTLSLAEREQLVALARELDCLIVEDSPYRELRYSGEAVTSIRELAPERTLQLGSFQTVPGPVPAGAGPIPGGGVSGFWFAGCQFEEECCRVSAQKRPHGVPTGEIYAFGRVLDLPGRRTVFVAHPAAGRGYRGAVR